MTISLIIFHGFFSHRCAEVGGYGPGDTTPAFERQGGRCLFSSYPQLRWKSRRHMPNLITTLWRGSETLGMNRAGKGGYLIGIPWGTNGSGCIRFFLLFILGFVLWSEAGDWAIECELGYGVGRGISLGLFVLETDHDRRFRLLPIF